MKEKLYRFFANRYGHDYLNYFLLALYLILIILATIFDSFLLQTLALVIILLALYRSMSRKYYARSHENQIFMKIFYPFQQFYKATKNNLHDKERKYYICPNCHQMVRVPRKKGKITITCPKCQHTFTRRT